jgi:hypothetical protein
VKGILKVFSECQEHIYFHQGVHDHRNQYDHGNNDHSTAENNFKKTLKDVSGKGLGLDGLDVVHERDSNVRETMSSSPFPTQCPQFILNLIKK